MSANCVQAREAMNERLVAVYVQRGRLRERIQSQRARLAHDVQPLAHGLARAEQLQRQAQRAGEWVRAHGAWVAAAGVALAVWRPRVVWRGMRWAVAAWRQWRKMRRLWMPPGL